MSILLTLFAARSAVAKPNHAFFHCQQPRRKIFTPNAPATGCQHPRRTPPAACNAAARAATGHATHALREKKNRLKEALSYFQHARTACIRATVHAHPVAPRTLPTPHPNGGENFSHLRSLFATGFTQMRKLSGGRCHPDRTGSTCRDRRARPGCAPRTRSARTPGAHADTPTRAHDRTPMRTHRCA